jgi:hypothetical protein
MFWEWLMLFIWAWRTDKRQKAEAAAQADVLAKAGRSYLGMLKLLQDLLSAGEVTPEFELQRQLRVRWQENPSLAAQEKSAYGITDGLASLILSGVIEVSNPVIAQAGTPVVVNPNTPLPVDIETIA